LTSNLQQIRDTAFYDFKLTYNYKISNFEFG
jgi:hypothetical protein